MSDKPRSVRITCTDGASAAVEVGGRDLAHALLGYTIEHPAGQMPLVILHASPAADGLLFEGMARVAVAGQDSGGMSAAEFLSGIDADALARAAMQRDDLDGGPNELTRAALRQLLDWAQGKAA